MGIKKDLQIYVDVNMHDLSEKEIKIADKILERLYHKAMTDAKILFFDLKEKNLDKYDSEDLKLNYPTYLNPYLVSQYVKDFDITKLSIDEIMVKLGYSKTTIPTSKTRFGRKYGIDPNDPKNKKIVIENISKSKSKFAKKAEKLLKALEKKKEEWYNAKYNKKHKNVWPINPK